MATKDFREIQVSSSLLVVIFLGVLALGVFIFLLGVSVGKKQVRLSAPTQVVTQQIPEPVMEPQIRPKAAEAEGSKAPGASGAPASAPSTPAKDTTVKAPVPKTATETKQTAAAPPRGLYYVQVLAVADKAQAQAAAEKYRNQGYTAIVVDPPAGEKSYKVRLGGFTTRDKATELRAKLNAAAGGKSDFWVVHY
jgi:cell division septation protein DedD